MHGHTNWPAFIDCSTYDEEADEDLNSPIRHVLEHFSISVFRLTSLQEGGLNINCMDSLCFKTLVTVNEAITVLRAMDKLHQEFPTFLVPVRRDVHAWARLLAPLFPKGTEATLVTVVQVAMFRKRRHLQYKMDPKLSDAFIDFDRRFRTTDRSLQAGSASHPRAEISVVPPLRPENLVPTKILESMVACVKRFALEQGLEPLTEPTSI